MTKEQVFKNSCSQRKLAGNWKLDGNKQETENPYSKIWQTENATTASNQATKETWLVPSKLLVNPLEAKLLVSNWPPRLHASLHLQLVV
jgi:hypothetical protein